VFVNFSEWFQEKFVRVTIIFADKDDKVAVCPYQRIQKIQKFTVIGDTENRERQLKKLDKIYYCNLYCKPN
jgi:sporulation protein YlmC with PRC-barrel domain